MNSENLETRLRNRARCNAEAAHDTAAMIYGLEAAKGAKKAEEYLEWQAADELSLRASRIEELEKALRVIVEIGVEAKRHEPMDDFDRGSRAARGETHDIAKAALRHPDKEGGK